MIFSTQIGRSGVGLTKKPAGPLHVLSSLSSSCPRSHFYFLSLFEGKWLSSTPILSKSLLLSLSLSLFMVAFCGKIKGGHMWVYKLFEICCHYSGSFSFRFAWTQLHFVLFCYSFPFFFLSSSFSFASWKIWVFPP